jgi:hypothetical protein
MHILASHSSEGLLWIIVEVDCAKELTDSQWLNRLLKNDKIKNIHLDKCFMDIAEVSIDMYLEVIDVKNFGNHNEPTLHGIFIIIEVIPHGLLGLSREQLVSTSVLPLMEAVRVLLPDTVPCIDMHSAQIVHNLLVPSPHQLDHA